MPGQQRTQRKMGAKRRATTRDGRRPARDPGAMGVQAHRLALTTRVDLDPTFPINILLGRNLVTEGERDAAERLARTHWAVHGIPAPVASIYKAMTGGGLDHAVRWTPIETQHDRDNESRLRTYENILRDVDAQTRDQVVDMAVYLRRTWLIDDLLQERWGIKHKEVLDAVRAALADIQAHSSGRHSETFTSP